MLQLGDRFIVCVFFGLRRSHIVDGEKLKETAINVQGAVRVDGWEPGNGVDLAYHQKNWVSDLQLLEGMKNVTFCGPPKFNKKIWDGFQ